MGKSEYKMKFWNQVNDSLKFVMHFVDVFKIFPKKFLMRFYPLFVCKQFFCVEYLIIIFPEVSKVIPTVLNISLSRSIWFMRGLKNYEGWGKRFRANQ